MKKILTVATVLASSLLLTNCATEEDRQETPQEPTEVSAGVPDFQTVTDADIDVSDQLPPDDALSCTSRVIPTADGDVTLKNFAFEGDEAKFYFAPQHSVYNSYLYSLNFENGRMVLRDDAAGDFDAFIQVFGSTEKTPVFVGLGGGFLSASFAVPREFAAELGDFKSAGASINGEYAGSCGA